MITLNTAFLPDGTITQIRSSKSYTYAIASPTDTFGNWSVVGWYESKKEAEMWLQHSIERYETPVELQGRIVEVEWYVKVEVIKEVA